MLRERGYLKERKNIKGSCTDFSISSGRRRKRFTRRNYSWIESLNCIGKGGPSNSTKAGINYCRNFSTLLPIRIESMHTLFGQEINKQREEEAGTGNRDRDGDGGE